MEPPLKSRFPWIIHDRCKRRDSDGPLSHPLPLASLIEHCRARPNGDMPSGQRQRQLAFAPSGGRV